MCSGLGSVLDHGQAQLPLPSWSWHSRRRELNWSWGFFPAIHLLQGCKSTRETTPVGPSLETEGAMAALILWLFSAQVTVQMVPERPQNTRHSDRKAVLCQGRHSLARPPSFLPLVKASYRELPSLLPPLTSQFPSSEPCHGCDVPLVPVRSLTGSQVPICHMNQSWKFIWSLGGLSPSLHDLSETWSKSTLLSGHVLPVCEMRLLCSKEIC